MKFLLNSVTTTFFSLAILCILASACQENDHAPYGDAGLGGTSGGGGDGDADGDTDGDADGDSDSDDDSDNDICFEDEVFDSASNRCWMRCPVGLDWIDDYCSGTFLAGGALWAETQCQVLSPDYHVATLYEMTAILGNCDDAIFTGGVDGYCNSCSASDSCFALFEDDLDSYWTSTQSIIDEYYGPHWAVDFSGGLVYVATSDEESHGARCVRQP